MRNLRKTKFNIPFFFCSVYIWYTTDIGFVWENQWSPSAIL